MKTIEQLEEENKKLKIQKKMLEISFELINNDRNRLIRNLGECELALDDKQSQEDM